MQMQRQRKIAPTRSRSWRDRGFEWSYCRKPTPDDFIVPRTLDGKPHTKSSCYKLWRKACDEAKVANRSLHSTRHTFISLCRRGGAREEVVEQITHNASGTVVDQYTHWDWARLCEAVLCLERTLDQNLDETSLSDGENGWRRRESKPARLHEKPGFPGNSVETGGFKQGGYFRGMPPTEAAHCASQETRTPADTVIDRVGDGAPNSTECLPPPWITEAADALNHLAATRRDRMQLGGAS